MEQFQPSYRTVVLVKDFVGNLVLIYSRFSRSDGGDMMEDNGWYASIAFYKHKKGTRIQNLMLVSQD